MKWLFFLILNAAICATSFADEFIWIEGEDANASEMQRHGWYDSVKKNELSGKEWLSHFRGGEAPVARYEFESPKAGDHEFWLRANPVGAAMSVRVNDDKWQNVNFKNSEQQANIAADGKPDLRFIAWVNFGKVPLKEGANVVEVRFDSGNNRHGGLDCIVLSREPFFPQGARKPGEKSGLADPGTWAFEPDRDRFSPESILDLSVLNEKPAGKSGYVKQSADGEDFVNGAGKPIRFWAVNTGVQSSGDMEKISEHARFLAKRGVNMVRHHGHLPPGRDSRLTDVNQSQIEQVWRLVAAMKKEGIYVTFSPYWASHTQIERGWGLKDSGNGNLSGLIFFDKDLRNAYKSWVRALLEPENPHTGTPLAKDPALAIFQIQNEDSLLFWTERSIQGEQRLELGRQFGQFLTKKYGSIEKAQEAWGGAARNNDGDDFAGGVVYPHIIWHMTQEPRGALQKRLADQLAFYTTLMADFNREIARFLKEDLGYEGMVNAGNWRTADQAKLMDAERMAYSVNEVIGVNRYFNGGSHTNPSDARRAGYLVSQGDHFNSSSALVQPWNFPLTLRQVKGHPMIIPESSWVPPLRYQSEGPFLVAAYSALTGMDIFYWFSTGDIGFGPPMGKWQISSPAQMGMFPAAALMFRQGYVSSSAPVVEEWREPQEIWNRQPPLLPEEAGYDPNRDAGPPASEAEAAKAGTITPLAYLTGPVRVGFGGGGKTKTADLTKLIDQNAKTVVSSTGQLRWNYGTGICTLSAPKAQGATGALSTAGEIDLGTLKLRCDNDYATVLMVSMDGADLSASKRILLQIGTTARPHGWNTRDVDDGKEIVNLGSAPWNMENTKLEIDLSNAGVKSATLLDANGMPVRDLEITSRQGGFRLKLPDDAMYVVLR